MWFFLFTVAVYLIFKGTRAYHTFLFDLFLMSRLCVCICLFIPLFSFSKCPFCTCNSARHEGKNEIMIFIDYIIEFIKQTKYTQQKVTPGFRFYLFLKTSFF